MGPASPTNVAEPPAPSRFHPGVSVGLAFSIGTPMEFKTLVHREFEARGAQPTIIGEAQSKNVLARAMIVTIRADGQEGISLGPSVAEALSATADALRPAYQQPLRLQGHIIIEVEPTTDYNFGIAVPLEAIEQIAADYTSLEGRGGNRQWLAGRWMSQEDRAIELFRMNLAGEREPGGLIYV